MKRGLIASVRDIVPIRPLTPVEALAIAERQAMRVRELLEITWPALPDYAIAELPRIQIFRKNAPNYAAMSEYRYGKWVVYLNGNDSPLRQRFTLAHEFKHILDTPFVHVLYRGLQSRERGPWIEQVCDFFAGCLLVPRTELKKEWAQGTQDLRALALTFRVSQAAMNTRLIQTGLIQPAPRCSRQTPHLVNELVSPHRPAPAHRRIDPDTTLVT